MFSNTLFKEMNYILPLNEEDVLANGNLPASAAYFDMANYKRVVFLVALGAVVDALTFAVKQDTSATETASIKAVANATVTIAATDDDKFAIIEVDESMLDVNNDFRYVTLTISGVATTNYAAITLLGVGATKVPVTQPTTLLEAVEVVAD